MGGLTDKSLPYGVDLAIPQVGGNARKTNHDYTHGHLPELIDIIIEEKALEAGADILIAQGSEGGGHTGDIGTLVLIPQVVDLCQGKKTFFGGDVVTVAAGGIVDGRGLAASLTLGASGVWVGTRFICAEESSAPKGHKDKVLKASSSDTIRTLAVSGRPLRLIPNAWVKEWESTPDKIKELCDQGITPLEHDLKGRALENDKVRLGVFDAVNSLAGQGAGGVKTIEPAKKIVEDMVAEAVTIFHASHASVRSPAVARSKL